MRDIGVALLVALAGCYSPSYMDCQVSCSSGTCPSGLTCEQGMCRSPGATQPCGAVNPDASDDGLRADGPPNDVDADGINNGADNCPNKFNPNQADEDGDMMGDVCDPCPPFASAADNMDSDGDGVGNSCDPSPTMMGNSIARFEGFKEAMAPAGATIAGTWTFPGGNATISNPDNAAAVLTWPQPSGTAETVIARFTVNIVATQPPVGMGVITELDINATPFSGVACWVMKPDTTSQGVLNLAHINGTDLNPSAPDPLNVGGVYLTDMTRRGPQYTCSEPMAPNGNLSGQTQYVSPNPQIGVISLGVSGRVEWVLIVSGP